MTIGTGIALAGVWIFAAVMGNSPRISQLGFVLASLTALGFTATALYN